MTMHKRIGAAFMAASLLSAAPAFAEGWRFALSGGLASPDISSNDLDELTVASYEDDLGPDFPVLGVESDLDDSDTAWGLQVGYRWGSYVAFEVGYVDLGNALYEAQVEVDAASVGGGVAVFDEEVEFESSGATAAVLGLFPIGEAFDVYGRVGLYVADTRVQRRSFFDGERVFSIGAKDSSNERFFGLGAAWHFSDSYSMWIEFQRFADVGDDSTGEADIDLFSVGVLFR